MDWNVGFGSAIGTDAWGFYKRGGHGKLIFLLGAPVAWPVMAGVGKEDLGSMSLWHGWCRKSGGGQNRDQMSCMRTKTKIRGLLWLSCYWCAACTPQLETY
jgi:hypothetical protein